MKVAAISGAVIAALAAGSIATPTLAQDYGYAGYDGRDACQARQHDNGTAGAVIGGIAGVLIGSNLAAHHGGRAGGAAIGGVAGALIGNSIGRSAASSSCDGYSQGYYSSGYETRGYDARYGYNGYAAPYRTSYDRSYYGHDRSYGYGHRY
jgi:hypothetical protein